MNYQRIIIAGNATRKPERRKSKAGDVEFTTLRVAVQDKRGESVYFPIIIFGKQAEVTAERINKGDEVLVEGHIDKDNNGRFNVVATRVVFGAKARGKGIEKLRAAVEDLDIDEPNAAQSGEDAA
jgi:single-stranded DNA-binding protein